jgi:hypothetical protein
MRTVQGTVVCLATVLVAGCITPANKPSNPMQVIVEGTGQFPASIAGRWQSDQDGWEFVLDPNGRISSAIISFGRVRVKPGQTATTTTLDGGKAVFEPGPWVVHYVPSTAELTIKITMSHVRVETVDNVLEGHSTDVFVGKVQPAEGLWEVQWTTFAHYTARTSADSKAELVTEPENGESRPLVFREVAETR